MKTIIIIFVILAAVVVGVYFIFFNNNNDNNVNQTPMRSADSISVKNFAFNPSTLTIKTGTKVTWVNDDSVAHTITFDSGMVPNSPILSPGQSYSVTFANLGSFNYHCSIHPMMLGTVIVTN
jgi:plastocyanin